MFCCLRQECATLLMVMWAAGPPNGCYAGTGSYLKTCSPGVWVTTQNPVIHCFLCTACVPIDNDHTLTCTEAPSTCGDITNVQGQIICNSGSSCAAEGHSCDNSSSCCDGLTCHSSGGSGGTCYGASRKLLK